jgi:hypothetical protein
MVAFERFKAAWDPSNKMNPGKLIHAYRMDENLRYGPDYKTPVVETVLGFPNDAGGLGRAVERCIGMGKCRSSGKKDTDLVILTAAWLGKTRLIDNIKVARKP